MATTGERDARAAWFVKQPRSDIRDAATATLSGGTLTVHHVFPESGNLFKSDGVNTYANMNANLIAWPVRLAGDFSVEATVRVTGRNKVSSTSGIALGMFESFDPDAAYAFALLSTGLTANLQYADGPGSVKAGGSGFNYEAGQTVRARFRRAGSRVYWGVNGERSADVSAFWKGAEPMYAGLAFGNVDAEVTGFTIRGGDGNLLWDSGSGTLEETRNASVTVDRASLEIPLGGSAVTVHAEALALGGGPAGITLAIDGTDGTPIGGETSGTAAGPVALETRWAVISADRAAFPSRLAVTPKAPGAFALRVINAADERKAATIAVCVVSYPKTDPYGEIGPDRAYPAPGEGDAYGDGPLYLEFDGPPTLNPGHSIKIFAADGTLADSVSFAGETLRGGGRTLNVGDQLVRVEGHRLCIQPHTGALKAESAYFIAIPETAVTGALNGMPFSGLSDDPAAATWRFTTRAAPRLHADNVTVNSHPGAGADFRSLQAALDALATALPDAADVVINVAPGAYREPVSYSGGKNVTVRGPAGNDRGNDCAIVWRNSNLLNGSNAGRAGFYVSGSNLRLENLSLANDWVRKPNADNQAETLFFAGGAWNRLAARNCSFKSNQDTLQIAGRAWFYDCYIEGNTDFIWGSADAALFERCTLRCVNDGFDPDAPLMVARTPIRAGDPPWVGKGLVLKDSTVSVDEGAVAWFGRNAGGSGFYDQIALINVRFAGRGTLGRARWRESAYYYFLGDASLVGWKSAGCAGLGAEAGYLDGTADLTDSPGLAAEYADADRILNRVVALSASGGSGRIEARFAEAPDRWDLSRLREEYGI